jgi:hypothetical protein
MPLVSDILRDAERNGLDPKDMYDKASGQVAVRLYSRLFSALPKNPGDEYDVKEVEKCARALNRLGAKRKNAMQSVKDRLKRHGRDWDSVLTPEQKQMYRSLVKSAMSDPYDLRTIPGGTYDY